MASRYFPFSFDTELGTARAPRRLKVHSGVTIAAYARVRTCPFPFPSKGKYLARPLSFRAGRLGINARASSTSSTYRLPVVGQL